MRPPELTVVIPAYDEERRIRFTLERVAAFLAARAAGAEIIVVDDGSRDATARVTEEFASLSPVPLSLERLPANRGKGYAVRRGVELARGDRILVSDADLSTPIEELAALEPHLQDAAVVIGSRAVDESKVRVRQPLYRQTMGKTFNLFVQTLLLPGISDTQCGFKLFRAGAAKELFGLAVVDRFAWDVEILYLARRRGHAIREVPVEWFDSPGSRVHPVFDSARMLRDLLAIRFRS